MCLALVESAKPICTQRLQNPDVHISVVIMQKCGTLNVNEIAKLFDIKIEQLLAQFGRKIGLGIVQKGSDVVLKRAFASALIVEEKRLSVLQHDVPGLEIAVEKIIAVGAEQEIRQPVEIVFKRLLVKRDARQPEKIVFKVIQIPGDRLAIEAAAGIADVVIQIAPGLDLKARQHSHNLAISFDRLRRDPLACAIGREKLEKRSVAEILFQVRALVQSFRVNFRHRQTVAPEVPGKFQEGGVLLAHVMQNSDRSESVVRKPEDVPSRAAELALQRLHPRRRNVEMPLKKILENVHEMRELAGATTFVRQLAQPTKDNIESAMPKAIGAARH